MFFSLLPDNRLLEALRAHRHRGRNEYPVTVLWYCAVLQPLLRHTSMRATLDDLRRNADMRELGGMLSVNDVPNSWNMSRFLALLGQEPFRGMLCEVFDRLVAGMGAAYPDFGRHCSGDATHLSARPGRSEEQKAVIQPDGGRKEYTDKNGVVTKAFEWFGYKLHVVCDERYEVPVSYTVTPASTHDTRAVQGVLSSALSNLPGNRMETFAFDKAADDIKVHKALAAEGVSPLIEIRSMWRGDQEQVLEGAGVGNIVYDEAGTVSCYDMTSDPPVRHQMAYIGWESSRGTLKYRCPAMHQGWACPYSHVCNAGKKYGMTVRVKQEIDLRRFPSIPRATKKFERLIKGRTASERVFGRLKVYWGADDGNIAGGASFLAAVGIVMVVNVGLATLLAKTPRKTLSAGKTRLSHITKAMRK